MYPFHPFRLATILVLCALLGGLIGCAQPVTPTQQPATLTPSATPGPSPTPVPTLGLPPTFTPLPATPTRAPTQRPTLSTALPAGPVGLLAYQREQETLSSYDLSGAAIKLRVPLPGAAGADDTTVQWANQTAFYLKSTEKAVYQVPTGGAPQKLAFIPAKDNLQFLVSPDGKQIAWSFMLPATIPNPSSELWVANIDGSAIKVLVQLNAIVNTRRMALRPWRWLPDGRLMFVEEPYGIGGYILFPGFASLQVFDLKLNRATNLTPPLGAGGLCLEEISRDLNTVLSTCTGSDRSTLAYINLANLQTLTITRQTDQNQVGSPAYSPAGGWLAYAYARSSADAELGRVAVLQSGSTTPKILGIAQGGYFVVKAWVNEIQFIVQRYDRETTSIWLFSRDSGSPVKVAEGEFIALMHD